ncbi:LacI family DNA-binding transcriptional regulator [Gilvibacter sediminis]|uniref:LacI family DNA-binding transcriptional regulator n=1 Tax=Gilvibacter sediminis TaxID=379071 RepID=UPI003AF32BFE
MPKMTLKKIASELEVSISTVSKALKDSHEIGEETRKKIQAFAALYNYKPNNIALSLKNQRAHTIGIIIPEIVHHFFTTVIQGVEQEANARGYNVVIGLSDESFAKEVHNMDTLANGSIDGFIISVAKETLLKKDYHHLRETMNQGMPIVIFDRDLPDIDTDKVVVDDVRGARTAVSYLVDQGCKRIGIITTNDHVNVGKLRYMGYQKALNDAQFTEDPKLILKLDDDMDSVSRSEDLGAAISNYLEDNSDLDAIFAVNEIFAIAAMNAVKQSGKQVPEDVKVVGFTDGLLSKYAQPPLATVSQHGHEMGKRAAQLLINRIENDDPDDAYQTLVVQTELIPRASAAK